MLLVGTPVFLLMVVVPVMLLGITVLSVLAVLCVRRNGCSEEQAQHGCTHYCCYFHKRNTPCPRQSSPTADRYPSYARTSSNEYRVASTEYRVNEKQVPVPAL